jgi:hypothetical protein
VDDVFYFGNLVGETSDLHVTAADYALVRTNLGQRAAIDSRFDFDRDGRVTVFDLLTARANMSHSLPALAAPVTAPAASTLVVSAQGGVVGPLAARARQKYRASIAGVLL